MHNAACDKDIFDNRKRVSFDRNMTIRHPLLSVFALTFLLAIAPRSAPAASFDCSNARAPGASAACRSDRFFTLPVAVSRLVTATREECRKLGGRLDEGADAPALIRTQDVDGDGKPDYLIEKRHLVCEGVATAFCHNNGCDMEIALSGKGYKNPIRETGALRAIEDGPDGAVIRIEVDKSRCGAGLAPEKKCLLVLAWHGGDMNTVYQEDPPGN